MHFFFVFFCVMLTLRFGESSFPFTSFIDDLLMLSQFIVFLLVAGLGYKF